MTTVTNQSELILHDTDLKRAALLYRAINHNLRQQMLRLMHHNARMTVTDLYHRLHLEQSVASQHLAILRKANLVTTERSGKNIFYSVNYQKLKQFHTIAGELLKG